jgi:hypothetical protein
MKGAQSTWVCSSLTANIRLGWKAAMDKHFSLFGPFVNYGSKRFYNFGHHLNKNVNNSNNYTTSQQPTIAEAQTEP